MIYFFIILIFVLLLFLMILFLFKNKYVLLSYKNSSYIFLVFSFLFLVLSFFLVDLEIDDITRGAGSDISFVLDVSQSMEVLDYKENGNYYSRLQVAKDFIKSYIINNPQNRYSLTIFAGDGIEILPFTSDFDLFFSFLAPLNYKSVVRGGTNFFEGLEFGIDRFRLMDEKGGGVILLSDFELPGFSINQKNEYLKQLSNIKPYLDEYDLVLYSVGIGTTSGGKIPVGVDFLGRQLFRTDSFGRDVISVFDKDFFDDFNSVFNSRGVIVDSIGDIRRSVGGIGDFPRKHIEVDMNSKKSISIYSIYISALFLIMFLYSHYLLRRRFYV